MFYVFCLPKKLFTKPTSTVIVSKSGDLLGALIADDGQWRFPHNDTIPPKFETCLIQFEDEYFYKHIGFNPVSIFNALRQNIKAGKVVRGGRAKHLQTTKAEKAISDIGGVARAPSKGGGTSNNDAKIMIFKELFFEN